MKIKILLLIVIPLILLVLFSFQQCGDGTEKLRSELMGQIIDEPAPDIYQVSGVPTKIIIDRNRNIRFRKSGFTFPGRITKRNLTAKIEMVLNDEMLSIK